MEEKTKEILSKKCLSCEYEGDESICPACGMLMEEQCPDCHRVRSECVCEQLQTKES